jgi:hypothetical protein
MIMTPFLIWLSLSCIGAIAGAAAVAVIMTNRHCAENKTAQVGVACGVTCPHCGVDLGSEIISIGHNPRMTKCLLPRAWRRTMQTVICLLILLQLIGILASTVAAEWDIETIVGTGPSFAVVGLLIAALAYRRRLQAALLFGLSVPLFSIACFSAIAGLGLSPAQAQFPIGAVIGLFAAAAVPLGVAALVKVSSLHYWYYFNLEDPNDRGYDALRRLFLLQMAEVLGPEPTASR